ncbi:response regulator transcription factor [Rugamonas apoptosis]|uniref:Response regulator transcription factor n=1 Tax=Rugamonas apoptosis TaxID=2758570 RepID=A0A7W2F5L5_9BURK|nr:response regulator transcription factor [Rugamonas apoptosis]MBA5685507.1 response regulator transcription factor [Rugamonas apoptosis]
MAPTHSGLTKLIRVLLICDLPITAWGLAQLIQARQPALELAGSVATVAEAREHLRRHGADVVLYDLDGANPLALIGELLPGFRGKVLAISSSRVSTLADEAVLAGANGLVCKSEPVDMLAKAIEKVREGEFWVDRLATVRILESIARSKAQEDPAHAKLARLTRKERLAVAELVRDPRAGTAEIAQRLEIGERTLRNHLTAIYAKLGVNSRVALYDFASRHMLARELGLGH